MFEIASECLLLSAVGFGVFAFIHCALRYPARKSQLGFNFSFVLCVGVALACCLFLFLFVLVG